MTIISPGVVETELGHDITDPNSQEFLKTLRGNSLTSETIAQAVTYAIGQPKNVDVSEIIVRPTGGL